MDIPLSDCLILLGDSVPFSPNFLLAQSTHEVPVEGEEEKKKYFNVAKCVCFVYFLLKAPNIKIHAVLVH